MTASDYFLLITPKVLADRGPSTHEALPTARCSPRWVHRHLPAARSACAFGTRCAGRVSPPMDYRDDHLHQRKVGGYLPVQITSMKMPSAWCRKARCRKSAAMLFDWSIIWTASESLYVPYDLPRYF
jgi:hypothetical protein